jgi:hypothetical protein
VTRWCFFLAAGALPNRAGALQLGLDIPTLPWPWTSLFFQVGLSANATITVKLRTKGHSPNAYVMLFNEDQFLASEKIVQRIWRSPHSTYLPCEWRASLAEHVDAVHTISASESGRYTLGVLQAVENAAKGLSGHVSFLNAGGEELSVTHQHVARVVLFVAWLFFLSSGFLFIVVALHRRGRSRLHGFILAALILKCFTLLLMRQDIVQLSLTGKQYLGRQVLWQFMRQVDVIMEVMIFYVVGLGWKVTRSYLRAAEWAFASTVSVLSLFLGCFEVACNTVAPCTPQTYVLTQFTLHSICYLVVIVATNFNIFTLQRQIAEALATPDTGVLYTKHHAYCWFRGFFLFFVIIPSVTNFLAFHVLSWDQMWVVVLVKECSHWLVQSAVVLLFRPGAKHLKVFELAVVESSDDSTDQE